MPCIKEQRQIEALRRTAALRRYSHVLTANDRTRDADCRTLRPLRRGWGNGRGGQWCHGNATNSQNCDDKKVGHSGPYEAYRARSPKMAAVSYRVNCGLAAAAAKVGCAGCHAEGAIQPYT
jgi:hypothetical protein